RTMRYALPIPEGLRMRLTSPSVQRLLNASERTLVASASAAAVKGLTLSRLRSKITRVRRLKDKYVDVARARRQAERGRAPRSRGSGSRIDAETATRKAAIFDDVLIRFTAQLQKLEAKAQREVDPATRKARAR